MGLAVKSLSHVSANLPEGFISPERSLGTALTPLAPGRPMNMMESISASSWRLNISIALEVLSKTTTLPHFSFAKLIMPISLAVSIWLCFFSFAPLRAKRLCFQPPTFSVASAASSLVLTERSLPSPPPLLRTTTATSLYSPKVVVAVSVLAAAVSLMIEVLTSKPSSLKALATLPVPPCKEDAAAPKTVILVPSLAKGRAFALFFNKTEPSPVKRMLRSMAAA